MRVFKDASEKFLHLNKSLCQHNNPNKSELEKAQV